MQRLCIRRLCMKSGSSIMLHILRRKPDLRRNALHEKVIENYDIINKNQRLGNYTNNVHERVISLCSCIFGCRCLTVGCMMLKGLTSVTHPRTWKLSRIHASADGVAWPHFSCPVKEEILVLPSTFSGWPLLVLLLHSTVLTLVLFTLTN